MIDQINQGIAARVATLGLTFETAPVPIKIRKLPRHQEGVAPVTQITVCKSPSPETVRRWGGIYDLWTYRHRVVVEAPNRDDQQANLPTYSGWRDQIAKAFEQKPADLMGLDNLRDCK